MIFNFLLNSFFTSKSDNTKEIDESLFERIGDEDSKALEELYIKTERTMYAYVLSLVKDHEQALDIVQETYLKIRTSAHLYKPMGKPLAWMFTIAKNLYFSRLRVEKRYSNYEYEEIENSIDFSYVTNKVDKIVLESAMKILSTEEREIVMLYVVSGMKHREIAKNLDLPLPTSLSKYYRAIKKLKKYLKGKGGF